MRPATAPETIVAEVAAKVQLKNSKTHSSWGFENAKVPSPENSFPVLLASEYPNAHHPIVTIETSKRFLNKIDCELMDWIDPASRSPNPNCMIKTSTPAINVQVASMATGSAWPADSR
mmetsp:Transcript_15257/g.37430  ORF Transcript_15257/g.37430 Transcript_15257/m.37430 type:complete len:118 (-) Transcript_15257:168-521(-)